MITINKNTATEIPTFFKFSGLLNKILSEEYKVIEVINIVKQNGGLLYAEQMMRKYYEEALDLLSDIDENEAKKSLELLLDYVINRKK